MGLIVMILVASVLARLFFALVSTSQYALRHLASLAGARKAFVGDGERRGMTWGIQEASGFVDLSSASLSLNLPAISTLTYSLAEGNLAELEGSTTYTLATSVTSMTVTYYNMSSAGLIMESTGPATATLACVHTVAKGLVKAKATLYNHYSCAAVRNAQ